MDYAATDLYGSPGGYGPVPVRGGMLNAFDLSSGSDASAGSAPQNTTAPLAVAKSAVSWKFLGEPYWRWVFFLIALSFGLFVWHSVLERMR